MSRIQTFFQNPAAKMKKIGDEVRGRETEKKDAAEVEHQLIVVLESYRDIRVAVAGLV